MSSADSDVGEQLNADAVGRGGSGFDFVEFALVAAVFAGEAAVFVEDDFPSGSMMRTPLMPSTMTISVFGDEFACVVQADDGRDVKAAAQDGGVWSGRRHRLRRR